MVTICDLAIYMNNIAEGDISINLGTFNIAPLLHFNTSRGI